MLDLPALVAEDAVICPRCRSPVPPDDGGWRCADAYLDRFLDPRHSLDAASSVFFLGRKVADPMTPRDAISYYQGGM